MPEKGSRITFNYKDNQALDPSVAEALGSFDLTGDGKVTASELMAGSNAMKALKTQGVFLKKLVTVLLGVVVVLLLGMSGS